MMNVQDFKQDNDAPKPDVAPETKESLPETTESHAPWAWDKSSKYTIMGYTAARMDTHLVDFIKEYAEKEEKVPQPQRAAAVFARVPQALRPGVAVAAVLAPICPTTQDHFGPSAGPRHGALATTTAPRRLPHAVLRQW